jgi:2'-5' RNA ligase
MYYALVSFPRADTTFIDRIRRKYDPTVELIEPHLTVVFPVPDSVDKGELVHHCATMLQGWRPFPVAAGELTKSPDHWLLLTLREGASVVTELYRDLHRGFLGDYARPDLFQPHIGLGQFLKAGINRDWNHPSEADFDEDRYAQALREVQELDLELSWVIDSLDLIELPDEVIAWARGTRSYPYGAKAVRTERFDFRSRE